VSGSGGEVNVGSIPHTGNRQLKKILYMCAIARFAQQSRKASAETQASKLTQLIENPEISNKKIVCSIANRLARVAWSIAKSGEPFDARKCRLLG
jgi:transposase